MTAGIRGVLGGLSPYCDVSNICGMTVIRQHALTLLACGIEFTHSGHPQSVGICPTTPSRCTAELLQHQLFDCQD
jgi:hypothetical protein